MTNKFFTNCIRVLDFTSLATLVMTLSIMQNIDYAKISLLVHLSTNLFQRTRHERTLTQSQEKVENLRRNAAASISENAQGIHQLKQAILRLPNGIANNNLQQTINQIRTQSNNLVQRVDRLEDQLPMMTDLINQLQSDLDDLFQSTVSQQELSKLRENIDNLETQIPLITTSLNQIETRLNNICQYAVSEQDLMQSVEILKNSIEKTVSYELIINRSGSRKILKEALTKAQKQVILVCPWLTEWTINYEIKNLIKQRLKQGCNIYIGWGNLHDLYDKNNNLSPQPSQLSPEKLIQARPEMYSAYGDLISNYNSYKGKLTLKLLGTHEKYIICDEQFAMIGSHNFLTSNVQKKNEKKDKKKDEEKEKDLEIGVKTNHTHLIQQLTEHFHSCRDYTNINRRPARLKILVRPQISDDFYDDIPF